MKPKSVSKEATVLHHLQVETLDDEMSGVHWVNALCETPCSMAISMAVAPDGRLKSVGCWSEHKNGTGIVTSEWPVATHTEASIYRY